MDNLFRNLPDFLVVGAAKSGTTSLWHYLNQHPDIFIPHIKEGRFFSEMPRNMKGGAAAKWMNQGPRQIDEYLELFKENTNKVCGDISNDYFYFYEKSIFNIKKYYGIYEPIIFIVLRNPIERVFSMYHHIIRLGSDFCDFEKALSMSTKRSQDGFAWMFDLYGVGLSYHGVKAYMENFKNVHVFLTEDMNRLNFFEQFFAALQVTNFQPTIKEQYNKNEYVKPKSYLLNTMIRNTIPMCHSSIKKFIPTQMVQFTKKILRGVESFNYRSQDSMSDESRERLIAFYKKDIESLSYLLNRDLSFWI